MLMHYEPRLSHIIGLMAIFASIAIAAAYVENERAFRTMIVIAILFLLLACVITWLLAQGYMYEIAIRYIETFIKADPEQRSALAFNVPTLRIRVTRGKAYTAFEDTKASAEHLRLFLQDSTEQYTAAERNWNTAERPRWAWQEIYYWLERHGKVIADSASGSHSYQWVGSAYHAMLIYYAMSIPNLNEEDAELETARTYAAEVKKEQTDA